MKNFKVLLNQIILILTKEIELKKIYENKNIKTLDTSTKLYEFFEKKEFKEKMIRMFISRPELLNQLRE